MIKDHLPYEEQDALEAICRYHVRNHTERAALLKHLGTFCNWIRADERAKIDFSGQKPPYLLALLSTMGIYGEAVLTPRREVPDDDT